MRKRRLEEADLTPEKDEEEEVVEQEQTAGIEQEEPPEAEPLGEIPPDPPTVKRRRPRHVKYIPCI